MASPFALPGASKVTVTTRLRLVAGLFATSSARSFRKIFIAPRLGEGTFPKGGRRSFRKAPGCQDLSERSSGKTAANEWLASDWRNEASDFAYRRVLNRMGVARRLPLAPMQFKAQRYIIMIS